MEGRIFGILWNCTSKHFDNKFFRSSTFYSKEKKLFCNISTVIKFN